MVINELINVLFWKDIKKCVRFYQEISKKYYPSNPDIFDRQLNDYIVGYVKTKDNFIEIINDYNKNGKPIWQEQYAQYCDLISYGDISDALKNGLQETGEIRYMQYEKAIGSWAIHLNDYAKAINTENDTMILELSTGAGLGTCAVAKKMPANNRLISVDIDFAAAKNADGIAKYLNICGQLCGLNANFWGLPFDNDMFDIVCTHYGLDESGEINTTIKEVSRILKENGKFIAVARKNPYDRHNRYMRLFDITESESKLLLRKARLYSGFDDLVETAEKCNLCLTEHKTYEPETSHHRILYVFNKYKPKG